MDNNARTLLGSVTVSGLSFGMSDATPSVRVDSNACTTAAWTSATSSLCVNTNGPSEVSSEVTVGTAVGTRYPGFTFDGALLVTNA